MGVNKKIAVLCNYQLLPERVGGMDYFFWLFDKKCKENNIQVDWFFPNMGSHEGYKNLAITSCNYENIEHFLEEGLSPKEAATKGTQQLIAPVASATLTTILAFIPLLSIQNITGAFIKSLPVTGIDTLVASFIIATTLTPLLSLLAS